HIVVTRPNWVIYEPPLGNCVTQSSARNYEPLKVILVPKGSKALLSPVRIEKYVARLSDEIAKLKKEGDKPKPINFSYYLSDWAKQYGFTLKEVKIQFDNWAKSAEGSEDPRTRGLKAFYLKNFGEAKADFDNAASIAKRKVELAERLLSEAKLDAYET